MQIFIHYTPFIIRVIKSRAMRWTGQKLRKGWLEEAKIGQSVPWLHHGFHIWGIEVRSPACATDLFLLRNVQTVSGAHQVFCSFDTEGSYPDDKVTGGWSWPIVSIWSRGWEWLKPPPPPETLQSVVVDLGIQDSLPPYSAVSDYCLLIFYSHYIYILFTLVPPSFTWSSFIPCSLQTLLSQFGLAFVGFTFFQHDHTILIGGTP